MHYGKKLQSQEKAGFVPASEANAVFHEIVHGHRLRVYLHVILAFEPAGFSHSLDLPVGRHLAFWPTLPASSRIRQPEEQVPRGRLRLEAEVLCNTGDQPLQVVCQNLIF